MKKTRSILQAALSIALVAGATVAQANVFLDTPNTQTLYWDGFDQGYWASVNVHDAAKGIGYGYRGGEFNGYFGTDGLADDFFRFFCIDLGQSATSNGVNYTRSILDPTSAEARQLSWLFTLASYPTVGGFTDGPASLYGKLPDATTSGAMQLAVWEIMFETQEATNGLDLSDGNFTGLGSDSAAYNKAQGWLEGVWTNVSAGNYAASNNWQLYKFASDSNQDYLAARYGSYDRNLPLPGTLALLGIGLAGLGLARRKAA